MLNKIKSIFHNEKYKFLLKYYLIIISRGALILKQYAVLLLDDILTPMQASMVVSVQSIANMLLAIPLSFVASKIGCKKTIMIGIMFFIASYVGLLYSKNVYTFVFYYFCFAIYNVIFYTLLEVLVYGNIKQLELKDLFAKYKSFSKSCRFVASTIFVYIGGLIVYKNPKLIFVIDIMTLLVALYALIMITERKTQGSVRFGKNYKKLFADSFKYMFKHRILGQLILFESCWTAILSFLMMYRSLYCEEIAVNDHNIGLMLSIQTILISVFQLIYNSKKKTNETIVNQNKIFCFGGILFLMSAIYYHSIFSYIGFTLCLVCLEIGETMTYSKMVSLIPDRFMATTLSILNLISNFFKSLLIYLFGYLSHDYSYRVGFFVITIVLTSIACFEYFRIKRENQYFLKRQM